MTELAPTAISRPRPPDLVPGYRLLELVGKGGMGEVHRALQLSLERRVAVKLLAPNLAQDPGFVARFEKEAAALAQLSHPNIVSIVDKGRSGDTYYLVMEFVEGPSLRELQKSGITAAAALRAVLEVVRAIDYAHGRGIVHRDLKPENILVDAQAGNIAKVSDFGLAGFLDDGAGRFSVTATHVAMGTLAYMAPEQRVDAKNADHRADIYSLGVMLYELLAGDVPMGSYSPPSARAPGIDARLDGIVERCLRPDPAQRYQTAGDLLADLEPLVQHVSAPPRSLSRMQRISMVLRRVVRATVRTATVAVVLAAAAVLTAQVLRSRQPRPVPELPGEIFSRELHSLSPVTVEARVRDLGLIHRVSLGQGPDQLTLLPEGRPVSVGRVLRFGRSKREYPVGRATLDAVGVDGQGVRLSAEVDARPTPPTVRDTLGQWFLGEVSTPRAALSLAGSTGRHATLVMGPPGTPLALAWVFGERRGVMLGPPSPAGATLLSLDIDFDGQLRAFVGRGVDRRPVGEPVALGSAWLTTFGRVPAPQIDCAEGLCSFGHVVYEVEHVPPPPPPVAQVAQVEPAPKPEEPAPKPPRHERQSQRSPGHGAREHKPGRGAFKHGERRRR